MTPQATQAAPAPSTLPQLPPLPPAAPQAPVVAGQPIPVANLSRRVLEDRRSELSRQLQSAEGRRQELVRELGRSPSDAVRQGLESRIGILDQRLIQIERDIAENGRALANTPRGREEISVPTPGPAFGGRGPGGFPGNRGGSPVFGIVALVLLAPLAVAMARRVWRGSPRVVAQRDPESDARLERIEQAVDAIAIEVERISEAQRFQNKLLGEGQAPGVYGFTRQREGEQVPR